MPQILVTTFERVLSVTLTRNCDLGNVQVVHDGLGIYFGMARTGRRVWIAERNLDINKARRQDDMPLNAITGWRRSIFGNLSRTGPTITDPAFDDLHQIAWDDNALFVTTGRSPFLVRRDLNIVGALGIPIEAALPEHLLRPDGGNPDKYHFNSVSVAGDRLWLLAHNWDLPSFALGMDLAALRVGRVEQTEVVKNLGTCCHDVLQAFGSLWVLDSGGSALVRVRPEGLTRYPVEFEGMHLFPRGLAQLGDKLVFGFGFWSTEREARVHSRSFLQVFDPMSEVMAPPILLGQHGNTCAVMAV